MAFFTPLGYNGYYNLILEAYNAQASIPADTAAGSTVGSVIRAAAMMAAQLEQQQMYLANISRLATIPQLPNNQANPDVDSFADAFEVPRIGAVPATGSETCTLPSVVVGPDVVIDVGSILQTQGGLQFEIIADPDNPAYNATDNGYPISAGNQSVNVTVQCLTPGTIGNIQPGTLTVPFSGPGSSSLPAGMTCTNAAAFTNGQDIEQDPPYKSRFTMTESGGRSGTTLAIIAAALAVQPNLIYSYGDQVNPDGSPHPGFFTLLINVANSGTAAPGSLITAVQAAVEAVRPGGISYAVQSPSIQPVTVSGQLSILGNFTPAAVIAAATAQWVTYANATGLNPGTAPSRIALFGAGASILRDTQINGVPCIGDVQNLLLNNAAADVTASFGTQLVAGNATFTAS